MLQDAIESFLHYLYWDKLDPRTSPQHAVAVLHVAHYYGATRLVGLCEAILAKEIKKGDADDEGRSTIRHILNQMLSRLSETCSGMLDVQRVVSVKLLCQEVIIFMVMGLLRDLSM